MHIDWFVFFCPDRQLPDPALPAEELSLRADHRGHGRPGSEDRRHLRRGRTRPVRTAKESAEA
ncbi:MAG: hypothetical protein MZV70_04785 [Desulfobacterales bacterium]|nr:hypothetical protein [Desulfobacterales bacterium]